MKRRTKKLLSLLLSLALVIGLLPLGQVAYAAEDLNNVSISSAGVLSWDAYEGADNYHIKSGALEKTTADTSIDLYDLFAEKCRNSGTWWVEIWAESGGQKISEVSTLSYTYSSPHPKLDRPTNVNWSDSDILSWDPVANATGYTVYILMAGVPKLSFRAFSTSVNVSSYLEEGTHKYTATVYATGAKGYPSSDIGTSNEVNRTTDSVLPSLANVQISSMGVISWDAFNGAAQYVFTISNIGFRSNNTSVDMRAYLEKNNKPYGNYWVEIYAEDSNGERITSKYTFTYSYTESTPSKVEGITLSPGEKTVDQGDSLMLQATLLPEGAEGTISWKSNNTSIATVDNDGVVTVLPTAPVGAQTAIVATCNGKTAAMLVTVAEKRIAVEGITLSPGEMTVEQGKSFTVQATLLPEGAKGTISWKSNNTSIATVDNKGVVTVLPTAAVGKQTAIVATCNGKSAAMLVTVTGKGTNPFVDVSESDYFYEPVLWAVDKGITNGTDATHFSPAATCTRGQVVTFLWRAAGSPTPTSTTNPFTDVTSSDYYYNAVLWAVGKNITNGTSATTFGPNAGCTRGQVVTFLHRFENSPKPSSITNPFVDVSSSEYYYNPVLWAVGRGITNGTDATHFSPNATCTRGQIVTFLYRDMD